MLLRRIARPLLAGIFISGGINQLRDAEGHAKVVEPVVDRVVELVPVEEPPSHVTLVRVDAAVKIGAGTMLALGKAPRLSAAALVASLVPTTLAAHRFWEIEDPEQRRLQQVQFVKNLGLLGGLLLAVADTEGKPSLAWRARRAGRTSAATAELIHRDLTSGLGRLSERVSEVSETAADTAGRLGGQAAEVAGRFGEQASEIASRLGEQAPVVAGRASEIASRLGEQAPVVAGRASEIASRLGEQAPVVAGRASERAAAVAGKVGERLSERTEQLLAEAERLRAEAEKQAAVLTKRARTASKRTSRRAGKRIDRLNRRADKRVKRAAKRAEKLRETLPKQAAKRAQKLRETLPKQTAEQAERLRSALSR
jgi:uncharacterized membrane protein YphA (DoxX/SURF4 family)